MSRENNDNEIVKNIGERKANKKLRKVYAKVGVDGG